MDLPWCARRGVGAALILCLLAACRSPALSPNLTPEARPPIYQLEAERVWQLTPLDHQRFDASGLLLLPSGDLLTVNDRGPELYRIEGLDQGPAANLVPWPGVFTPTQLAPFAREKVDRYDAEGLARDAEGRIYLSEEANRWILRWDSRTSRVERLPIDWNPVRHWFDPHDANASFEGVAVGADRLYVANERQQGRIFALDLNTFRIVDDFAPRLANHRSGDVAYADLSWFDGSLFVLLRADRTILRVDPVSHRVLAEYDYGRMERGRQVAYWPTLLTGLMEGLAVDREHFWLVVDNNGYGRVSNPGDHRPTLFRCLRPDRTPSTDRSVVRTTNRSPGR